MEEVEVKAQYGRVKGAEWFPILYKRPIMVLGQGGIGSWTSLLLSRIGCELHVFDMDSYEEHNMTGQVVRECDIGKPKTQVASEMIGAFSPDCTVYTNGQYTNESPSNDIVICGFDNMKARATAFENWVAFLEDYDTDKSKCFFQDGRLLPEQLQIFNIAGNDEKAIEEYRKDYLFGDEEVAELDCTFKQTSHSAAMIASHMVGFLTNWATNAFGEPGFRKVPFFFEYHIPSNIKS